MPIFRVADAARQLFWERIQTLAANHGVFRIWTQERSPFWKSLGFQPPAAEIFARLPDEWKNEFEGGWLTLQLKTRRPSPPRWKNNSPVSWTPKKSETERIAEKAETFKTIITIVGFAIGIICFAIVIYLFIHRNPFSQ